jgi:hypothetical protein
MRNDANTKRTRPNLRTCFKGDWTHVDADELRNHDYHGRKIETMDLETARQLLHQMVKEVYAKP